MCGSEFLPVEWNGLNGSWSWTHQPSRQASQPTSPASQAICCWLNGGFQGLLWLENCLKKGHTTKAEGWERRMNGIATGGSVEAAESSAKCQKWRMKRERTELREDGCEWLEAEQAGNKLAARVVMSIARSVNTFGHSAIHTAHWRAFWRNFAQTQKCHESHHKCFFLLIFKARLV